MLKQLRHPYVLKLLEHIDGKERSYLVTERVVPLSATGVTAPAQVDPEQQKLR